jgi:hypothetical protein
MITFDLANFPLDDFADLIMWCGDNCKSRWEIKFRYYQSLTTNGDCDGIELPDGLEMDSDEEAMLCKIRFGFNTACSNSD